MSCLPALHWRRNFIVKSLQRDLTEGSLLEEEEANKNKGAQENGGCLVLESKINSLI